MTAPRPLDDGTRTGWGLMAGILMVYGVMVTAIGAVITWVWKRHRRHD